LRWAGRGGRLSFALPDEDAFVVQEVFEVLYLMLWRRYTCTSSMGAGARRRVLVFSVPVLEQRESAALERVVEEVQGSMLQKMEEVHGMRAAVAESGGGRHLGDRGRRGRELRLGGS
jgi:hypothetical protein